MPKAPESVPAKTRTNNVASNIALPAPFNSFLIGRCPVLVFFMMYSPCFLSVICCAGCLDVFCYSVFRFAPARFPRSLCSLGMTYGDCHCERSAAIAREGTLLRPLCAYRAYEYIFYNIYTLCAISLLDLLENFLNFSLFCTYRAAFYLASPLSLRAARRGNRPGGHHASVSLPRDSSLRIEKSE